MSLIGKNPETLAVEIYDLPGEQADFGGKESWLWRGLLDIQVNGFGGVDFNAPEITLADYRRAVARIWSTGVTRFLATIITGSRERILRCLRVAAKAAEDSDIGPSIAGFHLEG